METEKTKRIKRIVTVSLRGSERKQRENTTKFIKAEAERKANARERKRRSRVMTKERNELQKLKKENMRRRKTEKQRRWREKMRQGQPPDMLPVEAVQEKHSNFCNKISKFRAVKKLKDALPQTPVKRFASMKAYLSSRKLPTV